MLAVSRKSRQSISNYKIKRKRHFPPKWRVLIWYESLCVWSGVAPSPAAIPRLVRPFVCLTVFPDSLKSVSYYEHIENA